MNETCHGRTWWRLFQKRAVRTYCWYLRFILTLLVILSLIFNLIYLCSEYVSYSFQAHTLTSGVFVGIFCITLFLFFLHSVRSIVNISYTSMCLSYRIMICFRSVWSIVNSSWISYFRIMICIDCLIVYCPASSSLAMSKRRQKSKNILTIQSNLHMWSPLVSSHMY